MAKILIFDIETAPKLAYVWRFFKENISPKQVKEHCHMISFAAKWLGEDKVYYEECRGSNDRALVKKLCKLLDEADIVVAHNGQAFDLGTVKARAMVHKLDPPSPYKIVDTLKVARKEFMIESNSLEYLAQLLDCEKKKLTHSKFPGFELWLECLRKNDEAWAELRVYNIQDVEVLEEVYLRMRPWVSNHPNMGLYSDKNTIECPKCGSDHVHYRGYTATGVSKFRRFRCMDCGGWGRERVNQLSKDKKEALGTNAL